VHLYLARYFFLHLPVQSTAHRKNHTVNFFKNEEDELYTASIDLASASRQRSGSTNAKRTDYHLRLA